MRAPLTLAALLILSAAGLARAAEPPDNVVAAVAEAEQQCKTMDGTPNAEAVLSVDDINGDGGEDWIVDYAKFKCDGSINPLCDSGGCTMQIYLWDGATAWNLAFDEIVQRYKFGKDRGKPVLHVTFAGPACDKPNVPSCIVTYRLEKRAIVAPR